MELVSDKDSLMQMTEQRLKQASKKEEKELAIIQKVLLGRLYSRELDRFNDKSTSLYETAVNRAADIENTALRIWAFTKAGFYFYSYNQYGEALPYFFKSSQALEFISDDELIQGSEVLKLNAYFFSTIAEYDKSIEYLRRALKLTSPESKSYGDLLNALGNCYLSKGDLVAAETYFEQTKQSAEKNKDIIRYAKALGDLARVEISRKNWQKAEELLLKDIALSVNNGDNRNAMFAQLQLGKLYWEKGDIEQAYTALTTAKQYAASKTYLKGFEKETVELLLQIVVQQKDTTEELLLRRELDSLNVLTETENREAIDKIVLKFQKGMVQWELEAEQAKLEKASLLRWTWTMVSILLLVVVVLIYISYKRRLRLRMTEFDKKILSFQYDKIQSEQKLNAANNSLASFYTFLEEKNQQIGLLEKEIQKLNGTKQTITLKELLSSHLMTDENWVFFKQAFIEEEPEYYKKLRSNFPELTESNLRIILLQKMGLSNSETSHILGVTTEAVKKAKQRLRKKYSTKQDILGFEQFLN